MGRVSESELSDGYLTSVTSRVAGLVLVVSDVGHWEMNAKYVYADLIFLSLREKTQAKGIDGGVL